MSDLDKIGRRHAEILRSSLAAAEPPPSATLTPPGRPSVYRGVLTALTAAVLVVAVLVPLALWSGSSVPPDATSRVPPPTASLSPFDLESFLTRELEGMFPDEVAFRVGVLVLAPEGAMADVEMVLSDLTELQGYSHISADMVAAVAARFAATENTEDLEGRWVAYGLEPEYSDSPVSEWEEVLLRVDGVLVTQVDFDTPTFALDEGWGGWQPIADLPFAIPSGAIVEAVEEGIVVAGPTTTRLIGFDGSVTTGEAPSLSIPAACCGSVRGFPVGDSLVLIDYLTAATRIFDVQSLTWREAGSKPTTGDIHGGYLLGAAVIDGELFMVDAASREGEAESSAALLDLDTGTWREIASVPSPISVGGVAAAGDRAIVAGTRQDGNNRIVGERNPVVYQHTEDEGWRQLPSITIDGQASNVVWVEGTGLLAWNYDLESALFDETGTWRGLGDVPMPAGECLPRSIPTTTGVVGICGGIAWFDPESRNWTPIWRPTPSTVGTKFFVVAQNQVLGLVEAARDQTQMITYALPPGES